MDYRYRDKVYLSNYMLDTKLFDSFNFFVEDAAPIRSVYILNTDRGVKILKKVDYSIETLMFIYGSLNVIRNKYPYVINFRESLDGKPYVEYQGGIYVVLDLIEGRECIFENPLDLKMASAALSRLHNAGLEIEICRGDRNKLGKMVDKYKSKIMDMKKYKDIADMHVNKSEFDVLYLEYADYYINCAIEACRHLENSNYMELCGRLHTLCHHDLAHHNILIGNDSNVYFVDFDYCVIDLPCHDLCNMITRAIKHNEWSIDIANSIVEAYSTGRELQREELDVLYGYLLFPQDFYDISTSYYMRTRDWDEAEFTDKMKRKAGYKEERENFLHEFKKEWVQS